MYYSPTKLKQLYHHIEAKIGVQLRKLTESTSTSLLWMKKPSLNKRKLKPTLNGYDFLVVATMESYLSDIPLYPKLCEVLSLNWLPTIEHVAHPLLDTCLLGV
jgi:hypothetical protein